MCINMYISHTLRPLENIRSNKSISSFQIDEIRHEQQKVEGILFTTHPLDTFNIIISINVLFIQKE